MFNKFGYFKEYYVGNKFIGLIKCDKDRDTFGFFGQKDEVLNEDIVFPNKSKIKKGTKVQTMLFEFCGLTK
jgi:hypothetical protein